MIDATRLERARAENQAFFAEYLRLFAAKRFDEWAERFWREDGVFRVAYPVNGASPVAADSRAAVLANMSGLGAAVDAIRTSELEVLQTLDPHVFVVRYRMQADFAGGAYDNRLLSIVRLEDGRIAELTEYYGESAYQAFLAALAARS